VKLLANHHADGVTISVHDQGPGIPPDQREAVFGKFKRLEKGGSGIGLGLFISRALMRSMAGDLWVDDLDEGSQLTCLLPSAD
jgi:signal transduction histidine kinase